MGFLKKSAKIAAGAGAAYLLLGEGLYESFINVKLGRFFRDAGLFTTPAESEFWENCGLIKESDKWYEEQGSCDTVLRSYRIKKNTYAKVYFNEAETDNWLIAIHGYTADPKSMACYAKHYYDKGFNVVMPYMYGHSPEKGHYCSMGFYDRYIVLDWIDYILSLNKNAKIVLHGVSMGSATTMMTTGECLPDNVVAAVADCGYTSCWDEYTSQVGPKLHLPFAGAIVESANIVSKLRGNFDFKETSPLKAVCHSKTPTLFIHGEEDGFVPYEMMEPLYEVCSAPDKKMLSVPNAFHAVSVYFEPELYWNTVDEFISKYFE